MELFLVLWLNHFCTMTDCKPVQSSEICSNYEYGKPVKFILKDNKIVCEVKDV